MSEKYNFLSNRFAVGCVIVSVTHHSGLLGALALSCLAAWCAVLTQTHAVDERSEACRRRKPQHWAGHPPSSDLGRFHGRRLGSPETWGTKAGAMKCGRLGGLPAQWSPDHTTSSRERIRIIRERRIDGRVEACATTFVVRPDQEETSRLCATRQGTSRLRAAIANTPYESNFWFPRQAASFILIE
jgi:hypothetical protein